VGRHAHAARRRRRAASPTAARWRRWPTIWPPRSGSAAAYTTCRPTAAKRKLQLSALLGIAPALLHDYKSVDLMFAVAEMREVKSAEEVAQMEDAFHIGYAMHTTAMRMCRAGVVEREIAGAIEGVAKSMGLGVSFPSIVSQHGETLHNLNSEGVLADGRLLLVDAGGDEPDELLLRPHAHLPCQRTVSPAHAARDTTTYVRGVATTTLDTHSCRPG